MRPAKAFRFGFIRISRSSYSSIRPLGILFNLPASDQAVNFLVEIAQGNSLLLSNSDGDPVMEYSLAGSSAAMEALIACGEALNS